MNHNQKNRIVLSSLYYPFYHNHSNVTTQKYSLSSIFSNLYFLNYTFQYIDSFLLEILGKTNTRTFKGELWDYAVILRDNNLILTQPNRMCLKTRFSRYSMIPLNENLPCNDQQMAFKTILEGYQKPYNNIISICYNGIIIDTIYYKYNNSINIYNYIVIKSIGILYLKYIIIIYNYIILLYLKYNTSKIYKQFHHSIVTIIINSLDSNKILNKCRNNHQSFTKFKYMYSNLILESTESKKPRDSRKIENCVFRCKE